MRFIGRKRELQVLEDAYESRKSDFIPIYGRRRVGKSELILHFLKDKRAIYFLGKKAPAQLQIREFLEFAARALDEPLLASFPASNWRDALSIVMERRRPGEKWILALDEFQWTTAASPELPSLLQELWDLHWRDSGDVMLILCGSFIGFMEREVLGRQSPLFGRRTAQILLKPFDYREAALFHPAYSVVDRARAYFLCGGIPYYLRFFSERSSPEMNLVAEILSEHSALYREPEFLLREELREVESYYAVLLAVASGAGSVRDITRESLLEPGSVAYYLKQLVELGYLRRRYPLTGEGKITRHVRYDLGDPLLRFWFRFVFPNQSILRSLGPERAFQELIRPRLDAYFGSCFERLCREALPDLYLRDGVIAAFDIGEFWSKETQIDVVGLRDDGWTDLGECKWGTVRSPGKVEQELQEKASLYPNRRGATLERRIFVQRRPPNRPRGASADGMFRWYDLEDLYDEV